MATEKLRKKDIDLVEKNSGDRKNVRKVEQRDNASTILVERRCFQFVEIKKNPETEEEEPVLVSINGKACRTPAEDIKWEEE